MNSESNSRLSIYPSRSPDHTSTFESMRGVFASYSLERHKNSKIASPSGFGYEREKSIASSHNLSLVGRNVEAREEKTNETKSSSVEAEKAVEVDKINETKAANKFSLSVMLCSFFIFIRCSLILKLFSEETIIKVHEKNADAHDKRADYYSAQAQHAGGKERIQLIEQSEEERAKAIKSRSDAFVARKRLDEGMAKFASKACSDRTTPTEKLVMERKNIAENYSESVISYDLQAKDADEDGNIQKAEQLYEQSAELDRNAIAIWEDLVSKLKERCENWMTGFEDNEDIAETIRLTEQFAEILLKLANAYDFQAERESDEVAAELKQRARDLKDEAIDIFERLSNEYDSQAELAVPHRRTYIPNLISLI